MQGLGASQHCGQGLQGGAGNVVFRLLGGQRTACRLGVKTQPPGVLIFSAKALSHLSGPDAPGGPELGYLLKEIAMGVGKKLSLGAKSSTSSPRSMPA